MGVKTFEREVIAQTEVVQPGHLENSFNLHLSFQVMYGFCTYIVLTQFQLNLLLAFFFIADTLAAGFSPETYPQKAGMPVPLSLPSFLVSVEVWLQLSANSSNFLIYSKLLIRQTYHAKFLASPIKTSLVLVYYKYLYLPNGQGFAQLQIFGTL